VVGGSGAGKSVLLRSILGLHDFDAGSIDVLGQNIRYQQPGPCKQWGVLFQGGALLSGLTVQENVELPIALHSDISLDMRREIACLKIFMVGLTLEAAGQGAGAGSENPFPGRTHSGAGPNCCHRIR
jgi:phospholipid/cholesterol/gamma-HCH transport system ATP-binding protein